MKCSDMVAQVLARHVKHVFLVSGGADLHLVHSIDARDDIDFICMQHEQACSFAAEAYARLTGMGCAIATSGPGVINLLGGIAAAFYDSTPCIFIGGQVTTGRRRYNFANPPKQYGFQEMENVDIVKSITKYAVEVSDPARVRYELDRCIAQAKCGRPGPTLLSLPDDIQRAEIA